MKVILKDDVSSLGYIGDIVTVADGYARNYLFPKNLAALANQRNIKLLTHEKNIIENKIKKLKVTAEDQAAKISSLDVIIKAKVGEEGKLFGAITNKDISSALTEHGIELDKRKILLDTPIKRTGEYQVKIKIHPEVTVTSKVIVEEK